MEAFLAVVFLVTGAAVGSFLNVCAYRIPKGESIAYPPSRCPACSSDIRAYDNIPVLSFLLLSGRCRDCGARISLKYPLVELITGVLWAAAYYQFGLDLRLAYSLFFITVLVVLSAIDYDTKTIPNRLLLPAMAASVLLLPLHFLKIETLPVVNGLSVSAAALGFAAGGGFLYLVAVVAPLIFKKEAMGGGDIKLAAFMGLFLGGYVMLALFIGFFLGALIGIVMIAKDRRNAQDMIPFGPFLAAGSVITLFFGPQLFNGYLTLAGLQ